MLNPLTCTEKIVRSFPRFQLTTYPMSGSMGRLDKPPVFDTSVILAVILTLLKVARCFPMFAVLRKSRKLLSTNVFNARLAKRVNRRNPLFPACKTPMRRFESDTRLQFYPREPDDLRRFSVSRQQAGSPWCS